MKPIHTTGCILSFALWASLGSVSAQDNDKPADKTDKTEKADKTEKTSSRNRVIEPSGSMLHPTDEKFVLDAAKGGMMEVQLGQTAQQKGSGQAVKDFGKKMEQDHTQANNELAALAKNKGLSLPTDAGSGKATIDKLSNLEGAAFDKAYAKAMVRDHKQDVKEFEREAANAIDSDVKAFAAKTLPTLREHLKMAEELQKK